MIFNQGEFMGELTDDQLRQIAASRNAGISQSVRAAEAAGTQAQSKAAFDQAVSSYVSALPASRAPAPWYQGKGLLIAGGLGAGALVLFLSMRRPRRSVLHSRRRAKKS